MTFSTIRLGVVLGLSCCAVTMPAALQSNPAVAAKPVAQKRAGSGAMTNQNFISKANAFVDLLVAGKFEKATGQLDKSLKSKLPAPKLQLAWQALTIQYGAYKKRKAPQTEFLNPHTIVTVPAVFGDTTVDVKVVFSGTAKVTGFFLSPHSAAKKASYKEAPYVLSKSFTEEKIKVGTGKWQLDGILTMPKGEGTFPSIILVHGSGPQDMDETIGPNKPFRDLARGLASKGIAVLRYEKRTKQHGSALTGEELKKLTVKEETIDDVVEAAKVLRKNSKIDQSKIVVLGHSLGGTLIPRIASADAGVSGFISMAGSNEPIEDAIIRQTEYIAGLSGARSEEGKKQLENLRAVAAKVKTISDADAKSESLILGAGPAYWLDLKAHDPLLEVKNIDRPVLFLQGGRDYQVTADGDFARWKEAVKAGGKEAQCEFKLYPQLNHLFMSGSGKCTPDEYMKKTGNVDEGVLKDISTWVKSLNKSG